MEKVEVERTWVFPTIALLAVGATIGGLIGVSFIFFMSVLGAGLSGGPLGFLLAAPLLLAFFTLNINWVLFGVPLWALFGGQEFAMRSSGKGGSALRKLGVVLIPDTHSIAQVTIQMSERLGLPKTPWIGYYEDESINAFAMGTSPYNALVAVTRGAVEKLSKEQLRAVIGHELGHIACNDMQRMTYCRGVQQSLVFFLLFTRLRRIALWLFTPFSQLSILRFSRQREFTADAIGARLTTPDAMIGVLERLEEEKAAKVPIGYANVMFSAGFDQRWLSTHPPLEARIAALKKGIED